MLTAEQLEQHGIPEEHRDAVLAISDLGGRTGARGFEIAKHNMGGKWYAHAQYSGARVIAEGADAGEAADRLAAKLLTGGRCMQCQRFVTLDPGGAYVRETARLMDGHRWDAEQVRRDGMCLWGRFAARWEIGCQPLPLPARDAYVAGLPVGERAEIRTRDYLAGELAAADAPVHLLVRARCGEFDEFGDSPHPTPITVLVEYLLQAGLHELAERAAAGDFDATKAESDAWWAAEGEQLVTELAAGDPTLNQAMREALGSPAVAQELRTPRPGRPAWSTPRPGTRPERGRGRRG